MIPIHYTEFNVKLPSSRHTTFPEFRSVAHLPTEYRKAELLHLYSMKVWGIYILPFQVLAMQFVLYTNFVLIRNWDHLGALTRSLLLCWTIAIQIFWYFVLHVGGHFYLYAKANRDSWKFMVVKDSWEAKYMSKFRKSTRPLGIGHQGYFIIKPLSVLKFFKGVVKGTIRVLLTIK